MMKIMAHGQPVAFQASRAEVDSLIKKLKITKGLGLGLGYGNCLLITTSYSLLKIPRSVKVSFQTHIYFYCLLKIN